MKSFSFFSNFIFAFFNSSNSVNKSYQAKRIYMMENLNVEIFAKLLIIQKLYYRWMNPQQKIYYSNFGEMKFLYI